MPRIQRSLEGRHQAVGELWRQERFRDGRKHISRYWAKDLNSRVKDRTLVVSDNLVYRFEHYKAALEEVPTPSTTSLFCWA